MLEHFIELGMLIFVLATCCSVSYVVLGQTNRSMKRA